MPLNPPSYQGQDVWYSRNVFINKVETALWQPAVPMASALTAIPVPPLPSLTFDQSQLNLIQQTHRVTSWVDPVTGERQEENASDIPNPDAPPGQFDGPESDVTAPQSTPPQGGNVYNNLIIKLETTLREANGGAWDATSGNPNLQSMCRDMGVGWGLPWGPRQPPGASPQAGGWCALFVSWILYKCGIPVIVGGRSQRVVGRARDWANYGTRVSNTDPRQWRKGDIVVVGGATNNRGETSSGNHVAFLWEVNRANDTMVLLGGNQGGGLIGKVTSSGRARGFLSRTISGGGGERAIALVRNWAIPQAQDRPLPGI